MLIHWKVHTGPKRCIWSGPGWRITQRIHRESNSVSLILFIRNRIENGHTLNRSMFVMHLNTLLGLIQLNLFCGEGDCEERINIYETFAINRKVRKIAQELEDTTIMAKLSEGDIIATESIYHAKCLVNYYNRRTISLERKTTELLLLSLVIPTFMFWK